RVELDRSNGKFRSWLIQSAKNFFCNDWKTVVVQRDRLVPIHFTTDDGDDELLPLPAAEPDATALDRAWATLLIRRAFQKLREENSAPEKVARYRELLPFLTRRPEPASFPPIAAKLGLEEATLRQALHRLRERFGALLRD